MVDKNSFKPSESTSSIRVILVNGEILEAKNYYMKTDTLVIKMPKSPFYQAEDRLIPLNQIDKIKVFETNERSIAFGALFTALFIAFLVMVSNALDGLSGVGI